ncbi:hypothetical protein LMJ53_05690 [Rheinheimera sp. UJ51]|uniref:hypothetical protein n=1 Tax=Rheinheimera sp. UJ51 TaxID=2892446 RepID=UPI001E537E48|nr:hypothetical protein [Rheinheimera sp. UJ51]MCC5451223.1 hypothetical protein [Rheinheimera sp. UJ51]
MSADYNERVLMQEKEFHNFIEKTKSRDSKIFYICLFTLLLTGGFGYKTLYKAFQDTNVELLSYQKQIADAKKESQELIVKIKSQEEHLKSIDKHIREVKISEITKLMEFSANHRKEIDALKADVQCIKNINSETQC